MTKVISLTLFSLIFVGSICSQVSLSNSTNSVLIDFSASTNSNVGTSPQTAFNGSGFQPNPTISGRLNSNAWSVTGWSDGNLSFGGSNTAGDYARGSTAAAVTTGGMYAFTGAPHSSSNPALMIQPGGSDFAPGTLTLRIKNDGTNYITSLSVSYNLFVRNDQARTNSFNFSYSTDGSTFDPISSLDYSSPAAADAFGWVQVGTSPSRQTTITPIVIAPGSFIYLRWSSNDISGSGSRDEFGLDDISILANFEDLTKLETPFCGYTAQSGTEFIWADSLGTPTTQNNWRYRFKLVNGATTLTWTTNNQWPILQFYLVPGYSLSTTYTTSVAWSNDNGATFSAYGPTCTLTSPGVATSSLTPASCGSSPSTFNALIFAEQVPGATQYQYRLLNSALSYTQTFTKTNNNFVLSQFTGLQAATVYTVQVAVNTGSGFGPFGPSCNITTPSLPTTQLSAGSCGSSPATYNTLIFADAVGGATQYEYRLINSSLSYTQTFVKSNNNFILSQFSGLQNNTTYSVSVRVNMGSGFGNYGTSCDVTTPGAPTTQLSPASCGSSPASYATNIFANPVSGAVQYQYQLINSALSYTQTLTKPQSNFALFQFSGLQNSTTYSVQVAVDMGSGFGPYGTSCNITTPGSPTTQLTPASCGSSPASYTATLLFANAVSGATQYEYMLTNASLSYTQTFAKSNNNFILNQFTGLQNNTTYSVLVRVYFNNAWGPYGPSCDVTTPASFMREYTQEENELSDKLEKLGIEVLSYPNPFSTSANLRITTTDLSNKIVVKAVDITGKIIEEQEIYPYYSTMELPFGHDLPSGIYQLMIIQGKEFKATKVIKQ